MATHPNSNDDASGAAAGDKRVIKKYPNRRLYDTVESRYITVADVRTLVLAGIEFYVTDQKTGEDITRSILLQIITEQEDHGEPLFTTHTLRRIIRFYGDAVQGLAGNFIERSLGMLTEQQKLFRTQISDAVKNNPLTALTEITQRNLEVFKKMQDSLFRAVSMTNPTQSEGEAGKKQE